MKKNFNTFCILTLNLIFCLTSQSQTVDRIFQINNYCDSLDKSDGIQSVRKAGVGVTLDYFISNGEVIKIIAHPAGYKYISAKETYYFHNNKSVYIYADIEISSEAGDKLTVELHKIYLDNNRIIKQLTSEQTFNTDSLYNESSDPVQTSENIRKDARFKTRNVDQKFERTLLQAIDNYLNARFKKDGDPVFNELYSPFI